MIVKPTNTLMNALAWAAARAPTAVLAPMRFPMRFDATTPWFGLFSAARPVDTKTYQSRTVLWR